MPLTRRILRTFLMMFPYNTRSLLPIHLGNDQFLRLLHWHIFPTDSPTSSTVVESSVEYPKERAESPKNRGKENNGKANSDHSLDEKTRRAKPNETKGTLRQL
ncbi:hypothetical protein GOBAR_AA09493 [Gossypium barbadense]|uniref:Uncharacterized protein n=1 Tax=Gossypium barbadense TaxID=3634 RepID=A0A2P5Y6B8_GOSBA|nr:hypothetical protein GOBAR_AA09493 [Gossypium barbadense]